VYDGNQEKLEINCGHAHSALKNALYPLNWK